MNLSIKYIFTNYLLDSYTIKYIFEKYKLTSNNLFTYINSFNEIIHINTIKNLINYLLSDSSNNILPLTIIINSNKIFLK